MSILLKKEMPAGGKREGSGRKPIKPKEKKVGLTFYVSAKNKAKLKKKYAPLIKSDDK
jgi:hypothetical protein